MDPFPFTSLGPRGRTATPAPSAAATRPVTWICRKTARAPGISASASIRARRAGVRVQPGGKAALRGVRQSELQISSSSADDSLSGDSGAEPALPPAGNVSLEGRNGGGAERWVLQWARHGAILSLLTSRDLC